MIDDKYYFTVFVNSTVLKSEIGNTLLYKFPYSNFSGIYSIDDITNSTHFSLRSLDDKTDVSEIAKIYGGGGHRNASGIKIPFVINTLPCQIIDTGKTYKIIDTIYI
jgi:oligoribonuclease NrnB/cAMP/cGMP phosphodiesterase (DHH superfamily)